MRAAHAGPRTAGCGRGTRDSESVSAAYNLSRLHLERGTRLGPYEVLSPIGRGGMGEVWEGRDSRLDRRVAIKISREQFSDRFDREARAVAALNHPHICTLHDVGPNYLVMEFIDGKPLAGPLPMPDAFRAAIQIADALEAAHRRCRNHSIRSRAPFSPDGRFIAYSSNEDGRFQVYVQTFPVSDDKWKSSVDGGFEPHWSADGTELFFLSEDLALMSTPIVTMPTFKPGTPQRLFQTQVPEGVSPYRSRYEVSKDGKRFLVFTQTNRNAPTGITTVLNWTAGLER